MAPKQKPGLSKQDYRTPRVFIKAVKELLGIPDFQTDLAADKSNAVCQDYVGEDTDALAHSAEIWACWCQGDYEGEAGWGWLNPPFGHIEPWIIKCHEASLLGAHIACLLPASVGSNWFRDYVDGKARVLMLNGRLAFIPDKPKEVYPKDLMLLLYGPWQSGYQVWDWRDNG